MRRLVLLAAVLLAGLSTVPTQAGAAAPDRDAASEHRRIVDYWTPARRAAAIPRDVSPRPMGKPGGGGSGSSVTGATWTGDASVAMTTGKVFFTLGGVWYVCSGSAVKSGNQNLVLSAGHCVHDGDGGLFATEWIFYPGYKDVPSLTLGEWTASRLFTTTTWATLPDGFKDDAGFAVVTGGSFSSLESVLTGEGAIVPDILFDGTASTTDTYSAFGYPAAKKYRGNILTYCSGNVRVGNGRDSGAMALACDMTGGSSGGPWLVTDAKGIRAIESLNSYGYASLASTMFGPIFGPVENATYKAASSNTASSDTCAAGTAYVCSATL